MGDAFPRGMIDQLLYDWAAAVTVVAVLAFVLDFVLTQLGARWRLRARHRWSIEGSYELNPAWVEQIDSGAWFSARLFRSGVSIAVMLVAARLIVAWGSLDPAFFGSATGLILLLQAPVLMLHGQNLMTFRALADPAAATGSLDVRRWMAYRQSAGYCFTFAALWLALWVPSQQAFFLGGAVSCLAFGLQMWRQGTAAREAAPATATTEAADPAESRPDER